VSLHRRLERLEVLASGKAGQSRTTPHKRTWERYFHAHENARRAIEGRESLPELPYTEEDREDDRACLEELIPKYKASPGWQSGEAKDFLDAWEQSIRDNLAKGA
jgi:hypothetical protein